MRKTLLAAGLFALACTASLTPPALAAEKVAITVNATQIFGTIDPAKVTDYTSYMAAVNLYDGLTTVAPDGTIIPQLAESWTVSPDNKTYTFKLKPGATFQDGTPVQASDVVYSLDRLLALNEGPSYLFAGLIGPESVKAIDPQTVEITLNKVYAPFIASTPLILVVNEKLVKANSKDTWGEAYLSDATAGAGPYKLIKNTRGSELVIGRYEGYHGGWTKGTPIDEIRFVITSDDATAKALAQTGELGLSSSTLTSATFDAIGALPNYKILEHATSTGFYIKLNSKLAPTDDVHIRRAIALAMDYDTIRNVIFPGAPLNGPLASTFKGAYLDTLSAPVFDLEKAKAEVALSKYAGQEPIKISHAYVAGLGFEDEIGLMFKSNLEQIGFEVALQPEPWNRITELAAKPETTPNTTQVFNGATYPSPDSIFYVQYHSKAKGTWSSMEWLEDPEIDALIDKARETTDVPAQNAIYKDLQQKLVDRQSDVYMLAESQRYAANKCLQGYQWVPMMSWDLNFSNFWWDCSKG